MSRCAAREHGLSCPPGLRAGWKKKSRTLSPSLRKPATTGSGTQRWITAPRSANYLAAMEQESPLLQPAQSEDDFQSDSSQAIKSRMAEMIHKSTALRTSNHPYIGWLGLEFPDVRSAVWMMRSMVACNVLSCREGTVLFLPVDPFRDPTGEVAVRILLHLHTFATMRGFL